MVRSQKIIGASRVFICDEGFCILKDGGVLYESLDYAQSGDLQSAKILAVGDYENLTRTYPNAQKEFWRNGVLLPTLVNAHIHFEFSNNATNFVYGDFGQWLDSVIAKRDDVLSDITKSVSQAIDSQLRSGVGLVGAISSYGYDMEALRKSALRVVYFCEAMGSNPSAIDTLFSNFKARLYQSMEYKNTRFIPAVALHSPYSLHHIYAKYVLQEAKKLQTPISAHFLESQHEQEWLCHGSGYFYNFFAHTFGVPNPKPFYTIQSFLEQFVGMEHVLLTHCLFADKNVLEIMRENAYNIVTCPRSNRLLNNTYLPLEINTKTMPQAHTLLNIALGTDGKSSNADVNILEEMRFMLFAYPHIELNVLATQILQMATRNGAKALGIQGGILEHGYNADMVVFEIPDIEHSCQEALQCILHAKEAKRMIINGREII